MMLFKEKDYLNFILGVLIFSVIDFINYLFNIVRFETNDDALMALISSGQFSDYPSEHLVFINVLYGIVLKFFYLYWPNIEWYTLSLIFLNIISFSVIFYYVKTKIHSNKSIKVLFLLFIISTYLYISIDLQFTKTAIFTTFSGLLLFKENSTTVKALSFILIFIGSLLRFEACILITLICLPLFFDYSSLNLKKLIRNNFGRGLLLLAICFSGQVLQELYYNNKTEWNNYREYNALRGKINDNPKAEYNIDFINNIGIDSTDYNLLISFFPDPYIIDVDILKEINEKLKNERASHNAKNVNILKRFLPLIFVLFLLNIMIFKLGNKNEKILTLLFSFLFLLIITLLMQIATIKPRVIIPSIICLILSIIIINKEKIKNSRYLFVVFTIIIVGFVYKAYVYSRDNRNYFNSIKPDIALIDDFVTKNPQSIVIYKASLNVDFISPYSISKTIPNNKFIISGWMTNIPFFNNKFNSFLSFLDGNVVFIKKSSIKELKEIQENIFKNYSIKTEIETLSCNDDSCIVRFSRINH